MTAFHHRKLPNRSTLLLGHATRDDVSFQSQHLQIWYNNADHSWVGEGEVPHKHLESDECFIVLRGALIVEVEGKRHRIDPHEFCCFPSGMYHAIVEIQTPIETLMIRAPSINDKIYKTSESQKA